jgi:hypothetical protein
LAVIKELCLVKNSQLRVSSKALNRKQWKHTIFSFYFF